MADVFANARVVTAASVLTQFAGFGKTLLIAHLFGAGVDLDGYYLALVIPSLLAGVVAGSLQTGFVSVYVGLLEERTTHLATQLVSQLSTLLILCLGGLCGLLWLCAEPLMTLLVLTSDETLLAAAVSAFRVVVFILLLNSAADYFALVLNSHKRFSLAALSPIASVLLSTAILAAWRGGGQDALSFGLLAGAALQIALLIGGLKRIHAGPKLAWPNLRGHLRKVLSVGATMVAGILLVNLNLAVDQIMASLLGEGAVSVIGYANRFNGLIVQILIVGVGTVLLPHLAQLLVSGRQQAIKEIYVGLAPPLAGASAVVLILIVLASAPLLGTFLSHGALTHADIQSIAIIWFWYSIGLLPMAWGIFLARYFQATGNVGFITRLATISAFANIAFNILLIGPLGLAGLAISTSLVYILTGVLYHRRFVRETNFEFGAGAAKAAGILAVTALFLAWAFPNAIESSNWALTVGGITLSIAAAYVLRPKHLIQQQRSDQ